MRLLLVVLLACACSSTSSYQRSATHAEHDLLTSNEQLRIDTAQHAELQEHELHTEGPREEAGRWYGPDGGLAFEGVKRFGVSTTELWVDAGSSAESHLQLDAGVVATHDGKDDMEESGKKDLRPAASCVSLGWLWGLVVLGIVFFGLRLLAKKS